MLALVAAALVGTASSLPSAADLIDRHHRALGRIASSTAQWTGTVTRGDVVEHFEVIADRSGRYRQSWTSPLGTYSEGSDGLSDWTQDESGDIVIQPTRHAFSFEYALTRLNDFRLDPGSRASVGGVTTIDGRRAYSLQIADGDRTLTLYIDAATALVDGADAGDHTIRYRTYRDFEGTPVPTVAEDSSGGIKVTRTIDSVTFGVAVAGKFDPPQPREPSFPAGSDEVATTFDAPHDLIVLNAKINDKPVRLLLDSGSSTSVIEADVAKNLQLPTAGSAQVQGAGLLSGTFARMDKLDVAGISFAPFVVEAVPLKFPAALARERIQGVLGFDFLSHVVSRIAYFSREIRFIKPSTFAYSGTGAVISADLSTRVPYVAASLGDADKGTFTVDTGSDQGLVVYYDFANAHPRDFKDPIDVALGSSSGVGGEFSTRAEIVTQFNLGVFAVPQVPAEVVLHSAGAFAPGQSDGLIGAKLLSQFKAVFLDYRGKRVILEK